MDSMTHTEPRSSVSSLPEYCRNRPPRSWFVTRHGCHFVKQRLCLATQTTIELVRTERPRPQSHPNDISTTRRKSSRAGERYLMLTRILAVLPSLTTLMT